MGLLIFLGIIGLFIYAIHYHNETDRIYEEKMKRIRQTLNRMESEIGRRNRY